MQLTTSFDSGKLFSPLFHPYGNEGTDGTVQLATNNTRGQLILKCVPNYFYMFHRVSLFRESLSSNADKKKQLRGRK